MIKRTHVASIVSVRLKSIIALHEKNKSTNVTSSVLNGYVTISCHKTRLAMALKALSYTIKCLLIIVSYCTGNHVNRKCSEVVRRNSLFSSANNTS